MSMSVFVMMAIAVLWPSIALSQTHTSTVYGENGRLAGSTWTNNNGTTIFYDSSGNLTGRMQKFGNTTVVYDAQGKVLGGILHHGRGQNVR